MFVVVLALGLPMMCRLVEELVIVLEILKEVKLVLLKVIWSGLSMVQLLVHELVQWLAKMRENRLDLWMEITLWVIRMEMMLVS